MNITIAIDSFKGSLTSLEAGHSIADGIYKVYPDACISICPLADGGEGTVEALTYGMGGTLRQVTVTGPLGVPVVCTYGTVEETQTAIIEMSGAAGITLISASERNPLHTTTYGVGEIICDAIKKGSRHFIIGIGGSATNDGGAGMLQALGFSFTNSQGSPIAFGAKGLSELTSISDANVIPELSQCTFRIACDVTNPLCGEQGCSAVYGPQKGATQSMISQMDQWLNSYASLAGKSFPKANPLLKGTGAAGGMGFAFLTFTNAVLEPGIKIIMEETKLENYIRNADFVITGEGCLDSQTIMGKAPIGVAKIAKKFNKPVIAFSGCAAPDAAACNKEGIDAFFPILRTIVTLDEAMSPDIARKNMTDTAEQVFRLVKLLKTKITDVQR